MSFGDANVFDYRNIHTDRDIRHSIDGYSGNGKRSAYSHSNSIKNTELPTMKTSQRIGLAVAMMFAAGSAMALTLGSNITIFDNNSTTNSWEQGSVAAPHEDNETEPGTIHSQVWDLEGMYLNGKTLSLVGGYNFQTGVIVSGRNSGQPYTSGDIFIDTNGNAVFGSGNSTNTGSPITNTYNYEYVIHLDVAGNTYKVYNLTNNSRVQETTDIGNSSPWIYLGDTPASGGQPVFGSSIASGTFQFGTLGTSDVSTYGLLGEGSDNTHYYITGFDLSFLPEGSIDTFHYTMQCGNDDLMGRASVPDGGATLVLLGSALLALVGIRRRLSA
jgi:hypothetical protein